VAGVLTNKKVVAFDVGELGPSSGWGERLCSLVGVRRAF
jgi:hypothetical protein